MDHKEQYQSYLAQAMSALDMPVPTFCRKSLRCAVQHATV